VFPAVNIKDAETYLDSNIPPVTAIISLALCKWQGLMSTMVR